MALIICPECKRRISETASSCPHCGYQLTPEIVSEIKEMAAEIQEKQQEKQQRDRRVLLGILAAVLLVFIIFITFPAIIYEPLSNERSPLDIGQDLAKVNKKKSTTKKPVLIPFEIITTEEMMPYKKSFDIRVETINGKYPTKQQLSEISKFLRSKSSIAKKTFVCFYLPNMVVGNGAWATGHYDPNLEVKILGITNEAKELFLRKSKITHENIIGEWIDEGLMSRKITIFRKANKYYVGRLFFDGSSGEEALVKKGLKYFDKDSTSSDHYVILSDGKLEIRDNFGLICTARPISDFKSGEKAKQTIEMTQHYSDEFNAQTEKPLNIGIKLVHIPAGEFMMGSPYSEKGRENYEGPQHRVKISKGFYMGVYEVTQAQYRAIMGSNPSRIKGDNLPVDGVSWDMAMEFCRKLSQKEGRVYKLPTEAQWEYACRAGTTTAYSFGNSSSSINDYAWYKDYSIGNNQISKTHPVGQKKPNSFGLYDMHGNLMEWCLDRYDENNNYYSNSPGADPQGPSPSKGHIWDFRVLRGGCSGYFPEQCRSASRDWLVQESGGNGTGFRVVSTDFQRAEAKQTATITQQKIDGFNAQTEKPLNIGISENQIMEDSGVWTSISETPDFNMGYTSDDLTILEIIWNENGISPATLIGDFDSNEK